MPEPGTEAMAGSAKEKEVPPQPFVLGEGLPAVLAKLANKIQKGEFVDMAELLKDSIEAERCRVAQGQEGSSSSHTSSRASWREVPDLLSWLQCFRCTWREVPGEELWVYMIFLIRESRRCEGEGWRDYDSMFCQQAVSAADLEWSKVNNSLFSVTFLDQGSGRGKACKFCQETDHEPDVCAWHPVKPPWGRLRVGRRSLHQEIGGRGAPRQSGSATLGMRADVCTTPIVGSGMSVQTRVAKVTIGLWSVAARAASSRASPGRMPSQKKPTVLCGNRLS